MSSVHSSSHHELHDRVCLSRAHVDDRFHCLVIVIKTSDGQVKNGMMAQHEEDFDADTLKMVD